MLESLLLDEPEAYYWIGYLLADGSVTNGVRLKFSQTGPRKGQVDKFAKFIGKGRAGREKKRDVACCAVQDRVVVPRLVEKYGLVKRKTYNPPDLSWLGNAPSGLVVSFFVGFVDGDGSISSPSGRDDARLGVRLHESWEENLRYIGALVSDVSRTEAPRVVPRGRAVEFSIANSETLKFLKSEAIRMVLPFFEPKWSKVDLGKVSRVEVARRRVLTTGYMLATGHRKVDIANRLGIGKSAVRNIIVRNDLKCYGGRMDRLQK